MGALGITAAAWGSRVAPLGAPTRKLLPRVSSLPEQVSRTRYGRSRPGPFISALGTLSGEAVTCGCTEDVDQSP